MTGRPHPWVTVIVQTDGSLETRQLRMPRWAARALGIMAIAVGAVVVLAAAFFLPIARTAARVPGLERRVSRLRDPVVGQHAQDPGIVAPGALEQIEHPRGRGELRRRGGRSPQGLHPARTPSRTSAA